MMSSSSPLCIYHVNLETVILDAIFAYENHAWPPSLASNSMMHHTSKPDLLECLESLLPQPEFIPKVDVRIIDGAALLHILE